MKLEMNEQKEGTARKRETKKGKDINKFGN
jgi:hypothetical protein